MISAERHGDILLVRLDRPERANAYTSNMLAEMDRLFDDMDSDDSIRAVIITGAGRHFCAGADLAEMRARSPLEALDIPSAALFKRIADFPKPVLAAINGDAVGGGLELALACDLRFAAESARFRFPELEIGIIPAAGGAARLARFIGLGRAKEMIFTGAFVDARKALGWGLVNEVLPSDILLPRVMETARTFAGLDARAFASAKVVLNAGLADEAGLAVSRLFQATLQRKS